MRLWHEKMIPNLSRQHLLGQHRECCALRGNGWGKKHATVDYVFTYDPAYLVAYHRLIIREMSKRGYRPDLLWWNPFYRGKEIGNDDNFVHLETVMILEYEDCLPPIFKEHNDEYFAECLKNLKSKGFDISQFV